MIARIGTANSSDASYLYSVCFPRSTERPLVADSVEKFPDECYAAIFAQ